jgi:hypothetical protein
LPSLAEQEVCLGRPRTRSGFEVLTLRLVLGDVRCNFPALMLLFWLLLAAISAQSFHRDPVGHLRCAAVSSVTFGLHGPRRWIGVVRLLHLRISGFPGWAAGTCTGFCNRIWDKAGMVMCIPRYPLSTPPRVTFSPNFRDHERSGPLGRMSGVVR